MLDDSFNNFFRGHVIACNNKKSVLILINIYSGRNVLNLRSQCECEYLPESRRTNLPIVLGTAYESCVPFSSAIGVDP